MFIRGLIFVSSDSKSATRALEMALRPKTIFLRRYLVFILFESRKSTSNKIDGSLNIFDDDKTKSSSNGKFLLHDG